jgi:hypothetical protein
MKSISATRQGAMRLLARSLPPKQISMRAYSLYVQFRPSVPTGVRGWDAGGGLDLGRFRALARRMKR